MRTPAKDMSRKVYMYVRVSRERKAKLRRYVERMRKDNDLAYRPDMRQMVTVAVAKWIDSLPD